MRVVRDVCEAYAACEVDIIIGVCVLCVCFVCARMLMSVYACIYDVREMCDVSDKCVVCVTCGEFDVCACVYERICLRVHVRMCVCV